MESATPGFFDLIVQTIWAIPNALKEKSSEAVANSILALTSFLFITLAIAFRQTYRHAWPFLYRANSRKSHPIFFTLVSIMWCWGQWFRLRLKRLSLIQVSRFYVEYEILKGTPRTRAEKRERKKKLRQYLKSSDSPIVIHPESWFNLRRAEKDITAYFEAVSGRDEEPRFLLAIKINCYVASLSLIAGLMAKFPDDWEAILKGFGEERTRYTEGLPVSVKDYQMFVFNCWLLWGPSVPLCDCGRWTNSQGSEIALQSGYGDENNSFFLVSLDDNELPEAIPSGFNRLYDTVTQSIIANEYDLIVRPIATHKHDKIFIRNVCHNQKIFIDDTMTDPGFVLDFIRARRRPNMVGYYSAYIWLMLVICVKNEEGNYVPVDPEREWLNVIPFFEHGNIADPEAYRRSKTQLVAKIVTAMKNLLQASNANADLYYLYGSAIDDPNCQHTAYHRGKQEFHAVNDDKGTDPTGPGLRAMLEDALKREGVIAAALKEAETVRLTDKVMFSLEWNKLNPKYAACALPEMIGKFYATLDAQKNTAPDDRPRLDRRVPDIAPRQQRADIAEVLPQQGYTKRKKAV